MVSALEVPRLWICPTVGLPIPNLGLFFSFSFFELKEAGCVWKLLAEILRFQTHYFFSVIFLEILLEIK